MSGYVAVLALTLMPALGNFVGGVLADRVTVSSRVLSFALHAAAGIVFAVVGVELMPQALAAEPAWLIVLLFVAGGGFAVLIDWVMGAVRLRSRTGSAEAGAEAGPWSIYFGVAVDLFSDGVMIGAGSTISPALGLLLSLGQVPADIPEGFATIATFKAQGMPRRRRLLLAASFTIPIVLGATISYFALRGRPDIYKLGLLAFTAGILLIVAVEEMVVEAHGEDDSRLASLFLVGGFALFVALGEFLEARSDGWEEGEQRAPVAAPRERHGAVDHRHVRATPPFGRIAASSSVVDPHAHAMTVVAVEVPSHALGRHEDHVLGERRRRSSVARHRCAFASPVTGSTTGAASMCSGSVRGSPSAERAA